MFLASPGPLLIPPPSSSPRRPLSGPTPPQLHPAMGTRPSPRQAAAAAAGGDWAWEARTGPRPTQTCSDTPATARLRRGRPLTTLHPTKRQPATVGAVDWGGRVTTARQTTTRAVPGCSPPPRRRIRQCNLVVLVIVKTKTPLYPSNQQVAHKAGLLVLVLVSITLVIPWLWRARTRARSAAGHGA
jgi:hypothetical protein